MALSQSQIQTQLQKLSPQQIQYIKLLQMNTLDFEEKMSEELLDNPALEKGDNEGFESNSESSNDWDNDNNNDNTFDIDEIVRASGGDDEAGGFRMGEDYSSEDRDELPIRSESSFQEYLIEQARATFYDEKEMKLALHLINSIEEDGYLRRELKSIVNDLAFNENIMSTADELEKVLIKIQNFDPSGIGARNLQECLLLQLYKKDYGDNEAISLAESIVAEQMDAFSKKHYDKIIKALNITEDQLKDAINEIIKLNPKPGEFGSTNSAKTQYIIPDFIVREEEGVLLVSLNSRNAPELRVSSSYIQTLKTYEETPNKDKELKDAVLYIKQKMDGARWFIDSVKKRQQTLSKTMEAIVKRQEEFFYEGDESNLKPMILKDIAEAIEMDISTVSRVANSKYVETEFGIFPLKFFFSEGVANEEGEDVSNREIKKHLEEAINNENKKKPLTDDALAKIMKEKGYPIARRTVAKYREQLNIPVARMRKEI